MTRVTADDNLLLKDLARFLEPVEVRDGNGKLLGVFVPANLERGEQLRAEAESHIDWAEIERRKQSGEKGEPFPAVLARLRALEAEIARRQAAGEEPFTHEEAMTYFRSLRQRDAVSG